MAETRRYALGNQLDIEQILLEAQHRWLRPAEICEILRNYKKFRIAPEAAKMPPSGSLFLFDRIMLRFFRRDGHNWVKKKDGKTVKEAHEMLKVGSVDMLHCYYAHGEENDNFQRRSYWMLEQDISHIVLVHYREVKGISLNFNRIKEADETIPYPQETGEIVPNSAIESSASSSFHPNNYQMPSQTTDMTSLNCAQASEYEDAKSVYIHQAISSLHSFLEPQQPTIEKMNAGHSDSYYPVPFQVLADEYQGKLSAIPGMHSISFAPADNNKDTNDCGLTSEPREHLDFSSWKDVLENCPRGVEPMPFQPSFSSTQSDTMGYAPKQGHEILGQHVTKSFGRKQEIGSHLSVLEEWQLKGKVGPEEVDTKVALDRNRPSASNRFIKEEFKRLEADNPNMSASEVFSTAAKNLVHFPSIQFNRVGERCGQEEGEATWNSDAAKIQEMHEQSHPLSALRQNDMSTEISLEATIQNGMVNLSEGRYDIKIDRTLNTIVERIKSADIGKIGVYGRAGVGKTTVMEALKDLPEIRDMFDSIIWVTIPKIWNLREVQMLIATQLSFTEIDDDKHKDIARVVHLLEHMKFLLILDDVGEHINLEMLGIPKPIPENGSKIVLMSRSQQVCEIMAVDMMMRLEDLLSWELFCQNVGEVVDSFNIQPIAKQLVEKCCHCSHAIILMAGALKYVSDVDVWKNALEWLSPQPASYGETFENLLINVLKFSCEHLADDTTKKCLRYCAKHCEKEEIVTESLIHQWIADGLVDTHPEGNQILQNLINANLLGSVKGGVFVKLQNIDRHILVNSIIQPEECKLFLMLGGLGLTEPPKEEEWENSKEIHLMHNELSKLPENPRCPMLSALFLQRNYKLRLIPPSFFDYMPALQVLNLSNTRIRYLPQSLFRLVSLKRLFLNDCRNFMMLSPKVGELKQLEVLDLEGTEIMDLPREIKNLTRLICLEVSLYGRVNDARRVKQSNAMISSGIISALSEVEELNIDVNPDDERWDACVEAIVNEVCSLMKLSTLKFYFPRVELLSHFEWNSTSMVYSLSNFRFIVGHHVRRIMTRLPCDVKFELERWDRCLKYVNGVGVPGEIKKVLQYATTFHLDRHTTVKKLSDFGVENMEQLKCCVVGECNELEVIIGGADFYEEDDSDEIEYFYEEDDRDKIYEEDDSDEIVPESYSDRGIGLQSLEYLYLYYMKNLRSIWEGPLHRRCLILLKSLTLRTCPKLTTIFTQESLYNLRSLEELTVEDCPAIISLVSCENSAKNKSYCYLPKLKNISVHYLPELASICDGLLNAPKLEWMSFYYCPKLKRLPIDKFHNKNLKKIKGEWSWWSALEWRSGQPNYLDDVLVPIDIRD